MQVLFALEDVTVAAERQRDWETPGGTLPLAEQMLMGRGLGMGVIYTAHALSVSQKILKNTETVIVLGLQDEDPRAIQNLLGTTPEQTQWVPMLQRGQMVALIPSVWPKPVFATFEVLDLKGELTEAERKALAQEFLDNVVAVKPAATTSASSESAAATKGAGSGSGAQGVSRVATCSEEVQILVLAATAKPMPITRVYDRLGLSRGQGSRYVAGLERKNLAVRHTFSTGKRGGSLTFLEVTQTGGKELKARGIELPRARTGGGWEHNLTACLVGDEGSRQGMKVNYEVDLHGARADVEWRGPSGELTFFNIGISEPDREAENALKLLALPVVASNRFVLVARDSAFARKFEKGLKAKAPSGDIARKVTIELIADFVDERTP